MSSSYGNKLARAIISTRCSLKPCKKIKISFNPWQIETKSIRYTVEMYLSQFLLIYYLGIFIIIFFHPRCECQMTNVAFKLIFDLINKSLN